MSYVVQQRCNFGKMFANNDWSKAMFSLFVSVEASSVYIGLGVQDRILFDSLVDQVYD